MANTIKGQHSKRKKRKRIRDKHSYTTIWRKHNKRIRSNSPQQPVSQPASQQQPHIYTHTHQKSMNLRVICVKSLLYVAYILSLWRGRLPASQPRFSLTLDVANKWHCWFHYVCLYLGWLIVCLIKFSFVCYFRLPIHILTRIQRIGSFCRHRCCCFYWYISSLGTKS